MSEAPESEILQAWCAGNLTLEYASRQLAIEPEDMIDRARTLGFKLPLRAHLQVQRLRDVNHRSNPGIPGE